ncbi:MAG: putative lipid II flippase FtsW [Terriglobales bacterium]
MSSKILSVTDSRRSRRQPDSGGNVTTLRPPPPPPAESEFRGLPNRAIITIVLTLCGFGLMAVFSASAPEALQSYQDSTIFLRRQGIACIIGVFLMFTISRYDYRKLKKWAWPLALASLGCLCLTLIPHLSKQTMGAARWIQLGPFQFQPSELCKVSSIILMASGLSKYFWWHRQIALRIFITMIMAGIVVKQPDLGSALMILGGLLSLLYVSGTNSMLMFGSLGGGAFMIWHHIQKTPYQMKRITSWLDPYTSPRGDGWNIIQAQYAIGSGGLWGLGFGRSLQKLYYLPVQHADFIFAVIAEEFGLLGCVVLLSLFALFAYHGFRTANDAKTLFGRLLAIGITSSITFQAVVNVAVTTGLVPVTGITLPFISYGGTSIVATLAMVGVLLSVSRDRGQFEEDDEFGESKPLPEPAH